MIKKKLPTNIKKCNVEMELAQQQIQQYGNREKNYHQEAQPSLYRLVRLSGKRCAGVCCHERRERKDLSAIALHNKSARVFFEKRAEEQTGEL